jgi:hypothetical protein
MFNNKTASAAQSESGLAVCMCCANRGRLLKINFGRNLQGLQPQ